jgi:tRNA-dihydrouridine synthase B
MKFGNLNGDGLVVSAPLAGISDNPYRRLARRFGAAATVSEMVSADGIVRNSRKSLRALQIDDRERPVGIQLFGSNPEVMHRAVGLVSAGHQPDFIDLNFGCPVRKVVNKNGGAALLKDLPLMRDIIAAAKAATSLPLTIKLRSGWDGSEKVFLEAGKMAEEGGVAAITLHPRTRSHQFGGSADWEDIRRLKRSLSIPVIGNGDVTSAPEAKDMLTFTGCDMVMIGRAAIGNPWILKACNQFLSAGSIPEPPSPEERCRIIHEHALLMVDRYGERQGMLRMRRQLVYYSRFLPSGKYLRGRVAGLSAMADLEEIVTDYLRFIKRKADFEPVPA